MDRNKSDIAKTVLLLCLYLTINVLFVYKFVGRTIFSPILISILYTIGILGIWGIYKKWGFSLLKQRTIVLLSGTLSAIIIGGIIASIILIDPYSIRVDRWSATSFFLDALFQGNYPYAVHTHVCDTNYPSPFPLWHYLNIPFWVIGDVGWQNVFFFLLIMGSIYYYFRSWIVVLSVLILLIMSPAYWWEILTRSDGLSNAFLVCSTILFIEKYPLKIDNRWWLLAIISGLIASTRLSAIIPMALYLFHFWLALPWKKQIGFISIALGIVILFFAPFVLWDTNSWIFFHRNPFMSQTTPGNSWILLIMISIAIIISYGKMMFKDCLFSIAVFMFMFMLVSQLGVIWATDFQVTIYDSCCDISYFTLSLPYIAIALAYKE